MFVCYTGWFVNHSEHNANMVMKEQSLSESLHGKFLFLIMMIEFAFAFPILGEGQKFGTVALRPKFYSNATTNGVALTFNYFGKGTNENQNLQTMKDSESKWKQLNPKPRSIFRPIPFLDDLCVAAIAMGANIKSCQPKALARMALI